MNPLLTILGISGSLRKNSYNSMALRAARQLVPEGVKLEIFEKLGEFPLFNQDQEKIPPSVVTEFKSEIRSADAILIATPEYNYSVPGVLKNAIDWASRPYGDSAWAGKPIAIMGASPGTLGTVRAQNHLRQMFVFLNMHAVNRPEVLIAQADKRFDEQGNLVDEATRAQIKKLLEELVHLTRRMMPSDTGANSA